jgi:hypothetical protein
MAGIKGLRNLTGMKGRCKGGLKSNTHRTPPAPESLQACAAAFLEQLEARAYSQGSLDAHHWALKGFLAWAGEQNLNPSRKGDSRLKQGFKRAGMRRP